MPSRCVEEEQGTRTHNATTLKSRVDLSSGSTIRCFDALLLCGLPQRFPSDVVLLHRTRMHLATTLTFHDASSWINHQTQLGHIPRASLMTLLQSLKLTCESGARDESAPRNHAEISCGSLIRIDHQMLRCIAIVWLTAEGGFQVMWC